MANKNEELKVNLKNKNGLLLEIIFKDFNHSINLIHKPKAENWDKKKLELEYTDPYCFCIEKLIKFINAEFKKVGPTTYKVSLENIISTVEKWLSEDGLNKVSEIFFNLDKAVGVPNYLEFLGAFEQHSKLKRNKYDAQPFDNNIIFITEDASFIVDTYAGKKADLRDFIERDSYSEICDMTNEHIWGEIYTDAGIEKTEFVPRLLENWEFYWNKEYRNIEGTSIEKENVDYRKEQSWRQTSTFISMYNDTGNIIKLASDFDTSALYPIVVLTMLECFDLEICLDEYCEIEFFGSAEWEAIDTDIEDDDKKEMFFIQYYE